MGRTALRQRTREGLLLLDGAMGTQLIARGIEAGRCSDYLNIESPEVVIDVHSAYFAAGSDAVLTNTFGGNRYALGRHGFGDKVGEINKAGAEVARGAAGNEKYVLGDIGPSGEFLAPLGTLKAEELKEAFAEQARGLLAGGVDGFIIETMTALEEIEAAIEAVKSVSGDRPVFASMAFDTAGGDYRTMMGVGVEAAVSKIVSLGVDAVGFNCGTASLDEYIELAGKFVSAVKATGQDVMILAEPNAGKPELVEDKAVYNVSPEDFAAAAEKIHSAGVTIIGGCCGTGPEHIHAVSRKAGEG
ncbi:MAG TPA: homocysteine S-methyltransferase family protein [Sedimentisphaerales bacterium]|nr:homocysteine S-methyltransferase family protein [Sedimentisphaerales bacterium]